MSKSDGMPRVLIVEDDPADAELCELEVRRALGPCEFRRGQTREEFLAALDSFRPSLILSDFAMPLFDGLTALKLAIKHVPETPFILVTGSTNEDTAVECMRTGAWDYVIKENLKRLGPAIHGVLEQKRLRMERKQAEAALRESEEQFRGLFEKAPIGKTLTGLDGRFLKVNAAFCRMVGYSEKELLGLEFTSITHPEDVAESRTHLDLQASAEVGGSSFEKRYITKAGQVIWVAVNYILLRNAEGKPEFFLVTFQEITALKRAEAMLREQLDELHRWQDVMLDREDRIGALKREVNELCTRLGDPVRYPSQDEEADGATSSDCRMTGDDRPAIRAGDADGKGRVE
jgi:PAS domain S-box-containing protein